MKSISKTRVYSLIAICMAVLIPSFSQASNKLVNGTGVSDEGLLIILVLLAIFQLLAISIIAGVIKSLASNTGMWQKAFGKTTLILTG